MFNIKNALREKIEECRNVYKLQIWRKTHENFPEWTRNFYTKKCLPITKQHSLKMHRRNAKIQKNSILKTQPYFVFVTITYNYIIYIYSVKAFGEFCAWLPRVHFYSSVSVSYHECRQIPAKKKSVVAISTRRGTREFHRADVVINISTCSGTRIATRRGIVMYSTMTFSSPHLRPNRVMVYDRHVSAFIGGNAAICLIKIRITLTTAYVYRARVGKMGRELSEKYFIFK